MIEWDFKNNVNVDIYNDIPDGVDFNKRIEFVSKEKKEELIQELIQIPENNLCPFPQHKVYAEIRQNLSLDQQKKMKENIKVTADGKIEIVEMKKKFSILKSEHNGKAIFDWSYKDKKYFGKNGIEWLTYLTNKAAKEECEKQDKNLLVDVEEVKKFIYSFPGETPQKKIFNLVKLFSLEKTGYFNISKGKWTLVGSFGYALLSKPDEIKNMSAGVTWGVESNANLTHNYYEDLAMAFIVCENCAV